MLNVAIMFHVVLPLFQSVSIQEEKDVMTSHKSPFLVTCHMAVQDITHLHMVMDFVAGGDMLSHLRRQECSYLPEEDVRLVVCAVHTCVRARACVFVCVCVCMLICLSVRLSVCYMVVVIWPVV